MLLCSWAALSNAVILSVSLKNNKMNRCLAETRRRMPCQRKVRPPNERCSQHRGAVRFQENQCISTNRHLHVTSERELLVDRIFNDVARTPVFIANTTDPVGTIENIIVTADGLLFRFLELMGDGTGGIVIKVREQTTGAIVAIKLEYNETERDISERLYELDNVCAQLRVRYIGEVSVTLPAGRTRRMYAYVMEAMRGNIRSMFRAIRYGQDRMRIPPHHPDSQRHVAFMCADLIRRQLICLYKQKLFYTDFKIENVMYKVIDEQSHRKKDYIVMLGDIGSMASNESGRMAATYSPPEHRDGLILRTWLETDNNMQHLLSWHIGVFFGHVANIYQNEHRQPIDYTINDPVQFERNRVEVQLRVRNLFGDQAALYLSSNPSERPSILETITVLYD